MSFNHGAVWWSELMTRNVPEAMNFYRAVCGWSFEPMPHESGEYQVAIAHGKPVAGIMDMRGLPEMGEVPPHWFTYFAVDDVSLAVEQTQRGGGAILRQPFDVLEVGRIAIVQDSTGAAVGLMTPFFPSDELVAADRAADAAEVDAAEEDENFPV